MRVRSRLCVHADDGASARVWLGDEESYPEVQLLRMMVQASFHHVNLDRDDHRLDVTGTRTNGNRARAQCTRTRLRMHGGI